WRPCSKETGTSNFCYVTQTSTICSDHFIPEDYERRFFSLPGLSKPNYPKLKTDELGVCVFPTIHAKTKEVVLDNQTQNFSSINLSVYKIIRNMLDQPEDSSFMSPLTAEKASKTPRSSRTKTKDQPATTTNSEEMLSPFPETFDELRIIHQHGIHQSPTDRNRRLKNKVISLQASQKKKDRELRNMKRKVNLLEELIRHDSTERNVEEKEVLCTDDVCMDDSDDEVESEMDQPYVMEMDEISASEDENDLEDEPEAQLPTIDGNIRTEPKFIVFWTQLLLLFKFCHSCKSDNPLIKTRQVGTKKLLFPAIFLHWNKYQKNLLQKAKEAKDGVIISGDGRRDSMGHSAKFCAYTIFCSTFAKIVHFDLVQRNQAGSSPAMEFMCFKLCMDYLIGYGIRITTFISDRHTSIAKYMRTKLTNIIHYFDIWHLKKSSSLHERISSALTNSRLVKGIQQASPLDQTSCLEGFRSVLNHFAPKMIAYIAMLDNTVGYVQDIYATFLTATKKELENAAKKLEEPEPMNAMLEKQPRTQAINKCRERKNMIAEDVPPTTPVSEVQREKETESGVNKSNARQSSTTARLHFCSTCSLTISTFTPILDTILNKPADA
ncbi:Hypothetical predicted protein, partial [Paramuricea clavata]